METIDSIYTRWNLGSETWVDNSKVSQFFRGQHDFRFGSETKLTAGYNYQRRPDYTRTITNLKFGYNWKSNDFLYHTLNLIDLNYVHLFNQNPVFINAIRDLYIKSSFTDHLISATNYSWMYKHSECK